MSFSISTRNLGMDASIRVLTASETINRVCLCWTRANSSDSLAAWTVASVASAARPVSRADSAVAAAALAVARVWKAIIPALPAVANADTAVAMAANTAQCSSVNSRPRPYLNYRITLRQYTVARSLLVLCVRVTGRLCRSVSNRNTPSRNPPLALLSEDGADGLVARRALSVHSGTVADVTLPAATDDFCCPCTARLPVGAVLFTAEHQRRDQPPDHRGRESWPTAPVRRLLYAALPLRQR